MNNFNKKVVLGDVVFSKEEIHSEISEYAKKINIEFKNKKLTIIIILNGAVFFGIELINKLLDVKLEMDFLAISSYDGKIKKKEMTFYKNIKLDLKGKDVLVIEDIVDSGKTSEFIYNFLKKFELNSIKICSLIRIIGKTKHITNPDWIHLLTLSENNWIVGFGLDYHEKYRNLKDIRYLKFEKSKK